MSASLDRRCFVAMLLAVSASGMALMTSSTIAEDAEQVPGIEGYILGRFKDRLGFERIYVKLRPGVGDAELIALARAWHAWDPQGWFWFLDDDEKAGQLLKTLPEVERGDVSNYPAAWIAAHSLGHVQMELTPSGRRWVLMPKAERAGDPLVILDRE